MAEGKAKVTAGDGLNVRTGAGTNFSKLGALTYGTTVTYTGEQNGWLQINYSNRTGYICKQYTQITQAATSQASGGAATKPAATTPSAAPQGKTMYTNASWLNVRSAPNTGGQIVGQLPYGSQVTVLGTEANGWHKISYNGMIAYVSGQYVQANNPSGVSQTPQSTGQNQTEEPQQQSQQTQQQQTQQPQGSQTQSKTTTVVVSGSLNIRNEPNTSCDVIGSLHNGDKVTYTEDKNGWLRITSPKTGYISRQYTQLNYGSGTGTVGPDAGKFDTSQIGSGGLYSLTTKQVAAIETGRKAKKIVDLKTKKAFNVSWDACATYHSDCTPMTPQDTTIFKQIRNPSKAPDDPSWADIYSWSWDGRPAAIQLQDGKWVACGYHQRPHAAIMGGNPGWPFKSESNTPLSVKENGSKWRLGGHFCLYYGDSPGGTEDCNRAAKEAKNMSL